MLLIIHNYFDNVILHTFCDQELQVDLLKYFEFGIKDRRDHKYLFFLHFDIQCHVFAR